jgi:anti-sigma regulatory factor (Ser/Thr protein kinase)
MRVVGERDARVDSWAGAARESVTLRPDPASVRDARRLVSRVCESAGLTGDVCDSAVLLASETVTNAVVHGRSEARLTVRADPTGVRVDVGDDNSRLPVVQTNDPDALDGRGMAMLEACASQWGVDSDRYGKIVWFEVRCA